jgi:hypothetical protein
MIHRHPLFYRHPSLVTSDNVPKSVPMKVKIAIILFSKKAITISLWWRGGAQRHCIALKVSKVYH